MKIICSIILLLIGSSTFAQSKKSLLEEIQADSIDYKLDSILLVGIGSSMTSVFLDYVSDFFIKELDPKKIHVKYVYLGKELQTAKTAFDTINKAGYKAILFFTQSDMSSFIINNRLNIDIIELSPSFIPRISGTNYTTVTTSMHYKQNFNLQLYLPHQNMKKLWRASADVSCEPGKTKIPKKLVKEIVLKFTSHKYI